MRMMFGGRKIILWINFSCLDDPVRLLEKRFTARWVALLVQSYLDFFVGGDICSHQLLPLLHLMYEYVIGGRRCKGIRC